MSRNPAPGFRRLPRIADQMTSDFYACVENTLRAERAGDFAAALEWHQSVPMFRRSQHAFLLRQLADWGPDLPGWVWGRIAAYLASRCEDGDTGVITRATLRDTVEGLHTDLLATCHAKGGDPVQVAARVLGESWVFHERCAYDEGALAAYLDEFASGRLRECAQAAREWTTSSMGGYRLGPSRTGARATVTDLATDTELPVLDLGAGLIEPGAPVLGRLVPSGVDDVFVFSSPPLSVAEELAVAVARRGEDDPWWEIVDDDLVARDIDSDVLLEEDHELATDIRGLDLLRLGTRPADHARVLRQLRDGRDEISRAAYRILMKAGQGDMAPPEQALVAAAVMYPKAMADVARCRPAGTDWSPWGDRVPEPARSRIRALA